MTRALWTPVLVLAAGGLAGWLVAQASALLVRLVGRWRWRLTLERARRHGHRPFVLFAVLVGVRLAVPHAGLGDTAAGAVSTALTIGLIGAGAWLLAGALRVGEDTVFEKVRVDTSDNRRARKVRTQIALLRRFVTAVVAVLAFGAMLMTFGPLRAFGTSLLASAGLAGVVAGLAAQTTLANVFAGLQLAFTDAVRLDDAVVVEGEWGWIEELTLTYVVVHLWDERRLVLPTSWFANHPFQNWTRTQSRVLGEVVLHLDFAAPVEELRREAEHLVRSSPLWDGQAWVLQVVDTTPTTLQVRVLASAVDAPTAFDLRCELREKLYGWLQSHHPEALPQTRITAPRPDGTWPGESYPDPVHDVTSPGRGRSQFSADRRTSVPD